MSGGSIEVRPLPLGDPGALEPFIGLPYRVYADDPNWVAPLRRDVRAQFDPATHPFHLHSDVQPFLATRGREVVGRIAAIHNRRHIEYHDEPVGFYGFFESVRDPDVAAALFGAAGGWLRERGLEVMRGPADFSSNEQWGLLVEGFDDPPVVMMPYNPPWYVDLVRDAGFREAKTLLAYHMTDNNPPEFLVRRSERLQRRLAVRLRPLRVREFEQELERVRAVYNGAWEKNWGFVPMTDEELRFMAHELKPLVARDPEQVVFVEDEAGETIGFALWLKDYNQALRHARGRLFPLGLLKILWHARKIDRCRVLALGLLPEHRGRGIDNLLYLQIFIDGAAKGIQEGEFSWVLEDNMPMRAPLEKIGARVYKRYRIYDRPL